MDTNTATFNHMERILAHVLAYTIKRESKDCEISRGTAEYRAQTDSGLINYEREVCLKRIAYNMVKHSMIDACASMIDDYAELRAKLEVANEIAMREEAENEN